MSDATFYVGPSVADVVRRLKDAGVDDGLIDAYVAEENRRNPSEMQRLINTVNHLVATVRRAFGPRYSRDDYVLSGPALLDAPTISDYGRRMRLPTEGEAP